MKKNLDQGIWVFAEQTEGIQAEVTWELIAKAAQLGEKTGQDVTAVLLGAEVEPLAEQLLRHGAHKVLLVEHENLRVYKTRPYATVLQTLAEKYRPSVFLLGATSLGRDLAPRVMAKLGTGLTADCLELDIVDGLLIQTKPSYGGNILCTITVPQSRPQMATVRPKVFRPAESAAKVEGEVIRETLAVADDESYEILGRRPRVRSGVPLDKAEVLIAAGRGVKKQEDLAALAELATLTGGRLACSRPLVDCAWFGHEDQIGQSGNTVKPKFLLNIGISGAVQYLVGMQDASCVVSVNHDSEAAIFDVSHYGAVAEYEELLPALLAEIKLRKKEDR